ncbi:MAG: LysR family transcriptional regulator [Gammaproteobacteria bacterium]|nr:LysR family transcriptional regulator [Gammaproteobacteria bacterium]
MQTCNYIKELRAFVVTCQQGNMSKASETLCTSQPTMSLQIKKLETELNVRLFERHGPKLVVTAEGETLYNLALPLVQGFDHLHEEFVAQQSNLSVGKLSIAAEESTMLYTLPESILKFVQKYPGVRLNLPTVRGKSALEMVMSDEADMAVVSLLDVPDTFEYTPFISYSPVLLTPLNHPLAKHTSVTISDIQGCDLVLPPSQSSSGRLLKMLFGLNGVDYHVVIETAGWEVIKRYVGLGLGVTVATEICVSEKDKENLAIIPLEQQYPDRRFGVLTRKGKMMSLTAQRFIEILYKHYEFDPTATEEQAD